MFAYIIRRLLYSIPVLLAASFLIFTMVSALGDPLYILKMNPLASKVTIERIASVHHLHDPIPVRYIYWLRDVFTQLPTLSETERADLRALTRFARRVSSGTEVERQALVVAQAPFAHDVGSRIGPRASQGYTEWSGMLKRWSDDFLKKLTGIASKKTKAVLGI